MHLSVLRQSYYALVKSLFPLLRKVTFSFLLCSFQRARDLVACMPPVSPERTRPCGPCSLKTEQCKLRRRTASASAPFTSPRSPDVSTLDSRAFQPRVLHRKEVIQPHLPIRLPCYDFTPIIGPTFDGWPPCGLPHRLRVLQTLVV